MWDLLEDNLNVANIASMQETHGQYWRIGMYDLGCKTKIFYVVVSFRLHEIVKSKIFKFTFYRMSPSI